MNGLAWWRTHHSQFDDKGQLFLGTSSTASGEIRSSWWITALIVRRWQGSSSAAPDLSAATAATTAGRTPPWPEATHPFVQKISVVPLANAHAESVLKHWVVAMEALQGTSAMMIQRTVTNQIKRRCLGRRWWLLALEGMSFFLVVLQRMRWRWSPHREWLGVHSVTFQSVRCATQRDFMAACAQCTNSRVSCVVFRVYTSLWLLESCTLWVQFSKGYQSPQPEPRGVWMELSTAGTTWRRRQTLKTSPLRCMLFLMTKTPPFDPQRRVPSLWLLTLFFSALLHPWERVVILFLWKVKEQLQGSCASL